MKVSIGETELRKKQCKLIRLHVSNNTPIMETNYEQYTSNIANITEEEGLRLSTISNPMDYIKLMMHCISQEQGIGLMM